MPAPCWFLQPPLTSFMCFSLLILRWLSVSLWPSLNSQRILSPMVVVAGSGRAIEPMPDKSEPFLDFFFLNWSYWENWSLFVRAAKLGESETGTANSLLALGNRACKQGKAKQRWAKFRDGVWIVLWLATFHCLSEVIHMERSIYLLPITYYLSNLLPCDFAVPPTRVNGMYFPSH